MRPLPEIRNDLIEFVLFFRRCISTGNVEGGVILSFADVVSKFLDRNLTEVMSSVQTLDVRNFPLTSKNVCK